jgi:hypothetical protein
MPDSTSFFSLKAPTLPRIRPFASAISVILQDLQKSQFPVERDDPPFAFVSPPYTND